MRPETIPTKQGSPYSEPPQGQLMPHNQGLIWDLPALHRKSKGSRRRRRPFQQLSWQSGAAYHRAAKRDGEHCQCDRPAEGQRLKAHESFQNSAVHSLEGTLAVGILWPPYQEPRFREAHIRNCPSAEIRMSSALPKTESLLALTVGCWIRTLFSGTWSL